jgi:uncharacterized protein (TIGR02246 family)
MKVRILFSVLALLSCGHSQAVDPKVAEAVAANDRAYEAAHAKGDAVALAAFFAEDAGYTSEDGEVFTGREAITGAIKKGLANARGSRIAIDTGVVEKLADEVVLQKGSTVLTDAEGSASRALFSAIHVKKDGKWKIKHLTETPLAVPDAAENLQELAWLLGKWEEKDAAAGVSVKSEYVLARNGKFITRNISVSRDKEVVMEGWQIIGWDPVAEQIHSWTFDDEGGFSEAMWSRDGNRWLCRETGTTPEGGITTSEQTWTRIGDDEVAWESGNRTRDGEPLPAISRITLKRVKGN